MALTERWSEDEMRTIHDIETQYRAAVEAMTVREAGSDVQHRCLTDNAELRAEGGDSRVVTGVAVRYGDEARLGGFRERIARGALALPERRPISRCSTIAPCRSVSWKWQDDEDALRFRVELTDGIVGRTRRARTYARRAGRGRVEMEFKPSKEKLLETDEKLGPLFEIMEAQVVRLSLVDDGAYPQSAIRLRVEPMQAEKRLTPVVSVHSRPRRMMVV